jgi:hypothetical protein
MPVVHYVWDPVDDNILRELDEKWPLAKPEQSSGRRTYAGQDHGVRSR